MVLFQSMQAVTLWTIATIVALIGFGLRKQSPTVIRASLRSLWSSRSFLIAFIMMVLILIVNGIELKLENRLDINWDFTPNIYQLEGQFVYSVQQIFNHPLLTQLVSFFYIVVFQVLIVASLGIYALNGNIRIAHALCYAITINYIVAIPFYLFFPVNEVWSYPQAGVSFRILEVFPNFEEQYRAFSGIDNCFPSLHTSISVTLALLATQSGNRKWATFTATSTIIIVFSIFYLGIHWLSDMMAGSVLALAASWVGLKLAGVQPNIRLSPEKMLSKSYSKSNELN